MITEDTIKQAVKNIEKRNSKQKFNFSSFVIGLAVGLTLCGVILILAL